MNCCLRPIAVPTKVILVTMLVCCLSSCSDDTAESDASGTFEATETIVPAEASGLITALNIAEGQVLHQGQVVGYIDSTQLFLKKKQLEAQVKATGSRIPDINAQTAYYKQQGAVTQSRLNTLLYEKKRMENLVKAEAATTKQLDDINAQIDETQKQLLVYAKQESAQQSALRTQSSGLRSDAVQLLVQIEQLNDQLAKCTITNKVAGTVLSKYAEPNEMAAAGKPLYNIADLSTMILRAYITGSQLPAVKLNQQVTVLIDSSGGNYKTYKGTIEWISSKAEFTPKTIQTKDERANLVYALKISVKNDSYLKIGMYGEVKF